MTERNRLNCGLKLTGLKTGPKEDLCEHENATSVLKSGHFVPALTQPAELQRNVLPKS
jgi:hypothetical protein